MAALKFTKTHNLVAFLEKPEESDGFPQIVDLNAHPIVYALTVNPIIYTSCIKQFWATVKAKTVNEEVQLQALMDGKKVIIIETSVRRVLKLKDAKGIKCLPNADIFEQLALIGFVKVFLDKQVGDMSTHNMTYDAPYHTKKIFANMKREGKGFSRKVTHLFKTMMVQAQEEGAEPVTDDTENVASVPTHSNDPLLSGEDRLKLNKLIELCTKLSKRVLNLKDIKTSQDAEITKLKKRVKKLERRNKSRTLGLKKLRKGGRSARIESSKDEGLGDQEDASKQGRKIADLDADVEVTLVDETQGRNDDNLMFDTGVLDEQEVEVEKTLIKIKAAKPKAVTTAATTTTTDVTRPKDRGVVVQEPSEFTTTTSHSQLSQLLQAKDKGKAKMIEPEKPLKRKDQIMIDKEIALNLQAQLQAELEE
ncbi:hypothetical protein Tco_1445481 [Tanacetum coccineum]